MGRRLDVANISPNAWPQGRSQEVIENVLGSCVSDEVKQAVGRAESRQQRWRCCSWSANSRGGDH